MNKALIGSYSWETSAGCSYVWISLDPYPHDHPFLQLLVTVSLYYTEPTVALG